MRRFLVCLVLSASFASMAARADTKIGYVETQRAVSETEEGKQIIAKLRGEAEDAKKQIEVKQSGLQKMQTDFEKQSSVLSDEAKKKKQEEMQKAYNEYRQSASELQDQIDKKQQQAMNSISQKMLQVIAEVAERDGMAYVADRQALLFAPPSSDVTNEVIRRYNDKYPAGGGAAAEGTKTAKSNKK